MSDVDVSITRPQGSQLVKVEVKGKLSAAEWEEFTECLRDCVRKFGRKLTMKVHTPRKRKQSRRR